MKTQNFTDFSTCCKSKRAAAAKAAKEPAAKKQKTDNASKTKTLKVVEIVDSPLAWDAPAADAQDEVICTPDIMPYDDSPPGTPPEMPPIEYAPPPGQRGLDAPPNVPVVKKIIVGTKPLTAKSTVSKPIVSKPISPKTIAPKPIPPKTIAPKPVPPKPVPSKPVPPKPTPKPNNTPVIKVNNQKSDTSKVVPTTQKITVPVQKGNVNSDEQWFGTAVIRSAEVTEYISSKVSLLAFMNSSDELTDEKKEEIYRTFQSHLDIAIAKLKNIKQNMTSSYKRLLSKQQIVLSGNTLKIVPASAVQAMQQTPQKSVTSQPKTPVQNTVVETDSLLTEITPKPQSTRSSVRRRRSYNYIESSSEEENYEDDDDDDSSDDFMGSKKKRKKKKATPKKPEPTPTKSATTKTSELVKIVDVTSIVKKAEPQTSISSPLVTTKTATPTARIENNKIILDVIDLIDDDSNDAPAKKENDEDKGPAVIDSDVEELLPDHLVDENSQASDKKTNQKPKQDGPIEIDDSDNEEVNETKSSEKDEKENNSKPKGEDEETKSKKQVDNEDSNPTKSEDGNNSPLPTKTNEKSDVVVEESNVTNDENSQTSLKSKEDCDDSNLNENSNLSEKTEKKIDDNSRSCDVSETKSSQIQNDEMTDSITKSESEKIQNGECSNDSSKVPNDMSDNAVDNSENINKNGVKTINNSQKEVEQDFEEILSGNVIKNKKAADETFEDEYSKFVSNSKSSFDDDLGEELDDALSLPPQNTLGFALGLKEKDNNGLGSDKKDKKVNSKNGNNKKRKGSDDEVENDLNVLRQLAENCISSDMETNDSST